MRKLFFTGLILALTTGVFAQTPQFFQYQCVVRDVSGTALINQPVNFQISIISGSTGGTVEYTETHTATTNPFGIATLEIGNGTPVTGSFASVSWGTASHFIKVEADPTGGTTYIDMGTTQLLSVPYALYSEQAGNVQTYSAGNGISISGNVVTNEAPDQAVTLTPGGATTISGTYPNFTISSTDNNTTYTAGSGINVTGTTIDNTAPDQAVTLTPGGATTISGTYPNFTISSTDNNTTYTAGSGINVTGTTIDNTAPDQTVSLTQGGATTITGTYPNFTISSTDNNTTYTAGTAINISGTTINNTAPDQTVNLTQGGATTISGTYPNFTISSTDNNTTYSAGTGMTLSGTVFNAQTTTALWNANQLQGRNISNSAPSNGQVLGWNGSNWAPANDLNSGTPGGINKSIQYNNAGVFGGNSNFIWDNSNERLGIGLNNPTGRVVIQGSSSAPATEPLFEIKNRFGQQIMVVYEDSVHFYISDDVISSNKGGFAVSGRNNAKSLTNDFLTINPDSTRVYTSDMVKGFGVRNIAGSSKTSYMTLNPNNYFIGHQSGLNNTTGLYNSYLGYQAGRLNISGSRCIFIGYQSGYNNSSGSDNVSIGNQSLYTNTTGYSNTANGYQALYSNFDGYNNNAFGYKALFSNYGGGAGSGSNNNAMGTNALYSNTYGNDNIAIGTNSSYFNTTGAQNLSIGNSALQYNTTGYANVAIGNVTMQKNTTGPSNTAVGEQCLYNNTTGGSNVAIGRWALYYNNASSNTAVGAIAFFSAVPTTYTNSTALGNSTQITASNQIRVGSNSVTSIGGQVGWTTLSDARFKQNVKSNVPGLDFIKRLNPVTYTIDPELIDDYIKFPDSLRMKEGYAGKRALIQSGFIAQEVEQAAKETGYDFSGVDKPKNENDYYGLRYGEFTVPLVKAVQDLYNISIEQSNKIYKLEEENKELKNSIIELNNLLKTQK